MFMHGRIRPEAEYDADVVVAARAVGVFECGVPVEHVARWAFNFTFVVWVYDRD